MDTFSDRAEKYALECPDILAKLNDEDWFTACFEYQYQIVFAQANLVPWIYRYTLRDAHRRWQDDLYRVSEIELQGSELDHFKQCGHLCYWLRRCQPIRECYEPQPQENFLGRELVLEDYGDLRDLLFQYANEYLAFDIGFRICRYIEAKRDDRKRPITHFVLDRDYIITVSHFLNTKNVSPHALFLIYKSLFFQLEQS